MRSSRSASARAWLETGLLTVAAPTLGRLADASDPFRLEAPFPWLALAPLLVGLQHGLLPALASSSLLATMAYAYAHAVAPTEQPVLVGFAAGCFAIAALAGQFRDMFRLRTRELAKTGDELEEQLERLSRAHSALKLSHARLEERLAAERWSLDACLEHAQRALEGVSSPAAQAQVVLDVLAAHALVQGASLYDADERGLKRFPLAVLGQPAGLVFAHPLMQRAHATKQLVALSGTEPTAGDGRVLAAVPLIAAGGRVLAVVAIHQMPFMAFHADQLDKLAVICARIADLLDLRTRPFGVAATAQVSRDSASAEVERSSRPSQPIAVS